MSISEMETLILNKKGFIVLEQNDFEEIQLKSAQKTTTIKKLSLKAGRNHAIRLIDKWAKGR